MICVSVGHIWLMWLTWHWIVVCRGKKITDIAWFIYIMTGFLFLIAAGKLLAAALHAASGALFHTAVCIASACACASSTAAAVNLLSNGLSSPAVYCFQVAVVYCCWAYQTEMVYN